LFKEAMEASAASPSTEKTMAPGSLMEVVEVMEGASFSELLRE